MKAYRDTAWVKPGMVLHLEKSNAIAAGEALIWIVSAGSTNVKAINLLDHCKIILFHRTRLVGAKHKYTCEIPDEYQWKTR